MYTSIPTEIRRNPPSRTMATTVASNKHQPPTRALPHPDRACAEALFPSRKDYMLEKLHTFLMATHGCSPIPSTLRPGKCVRTSGVAGNRGRARGKHAARGKGPWRSPREGTFRDARYVRNLSSTAAPPPPPRLFFFSCDFARGVIFQRTGKCSHYREKPCGAPARRCTITRQPSVRERRQPVAQTENHARWRTTFSRRRISRRDSQPSSIGDRQHLGIGGKKRVSLSNSS